MAIRHIDGPDGGRLVTTKAAADHLGVSEDAFERLVGRRPGTAVPDLTAWVATWLRPVMVGKAVRWDWLDVVCLAHVLARRTEAAPPPAAGDGD